MSTNIPAVQNAPKVINAEFVKLTIQNKANTSTNTYYFSNSYKAETINGEVYQPLGGYLDVSSQQRDLQLTAYDTTIILTGIDQININHVLSDERIIKGAVVEVWRGFYNDNYILNTTTSPPVRRYRGVVTSWSISEDRNDNNLVYTVSLNCSNFKTVLENTISGRYTNPKSWESYYPQDYSMRNVPNLINANFDFGKKVGKIGQSTTGTNIYTVSPK